MLAKETMKKPHTYHLIYITFVQSFVYRYVENSNQSLIRLMDPVIIERVEVSVICLF